MRDRPAGEERISPIPSGPQQVIFRQAQVLSGAQQVADPDRSNEGSGLTIGWIERFLYTAFRYRNSDGRCPIGCRPI
jgi:hypothetical protein